MIKEFLQLHGEYHDDKSFKDMTTLKMGGRIAHFVMPENKDELKVIVNFLKNELGEDQPAPDDRIRS